MSSDEVKIGDTVIYRQGQMRYWPAVVISVNKSRKDVDLIVFTSQGPLNYMNVSCGDREYQWSFREI